MSVGVLIPALNEEQTVATVVREYLDHPAVDEVVVSDNASSDETAHQAERAGARVVTASPRGYGEAFRQGLSQMTSEWIFKIDADFRNPSRRWLDLLLETAARGRSELIKPCWAATDEDPDLVTNMVAIPILKRLYPTLSYLRSPLSGVYLFKRRSFPPAQLVPTFALDVQLLVLAAHQGIWVEQVQIESVFHGKRSLEHYFMMADQLIDFFLCGAAGEEFKD